MAACWENMAAWMPWNRPSSHPTSWAWATRSSASLGMSLSNGRVSRDSSSRRSGEMPSASSRTDVSKISFNRVRLASSSWARRTSSSSSLVMAPMRSTLAGWEIVSVDSSSAPSSWTTTTGVWSGRSAGRPRRPVFWSAMVVPFPSGCQRHDRSYDGDVKVSTRGDYASRALLSLALHADGSRPTSVRDVAERTGLPQPYLEQILLALKGAGLVRSKRGVGGGYVLARHPSEITLGQIVSAVDGPIVAGDFGEPHQNGACDHEGQCVLLSVWAEVGGHMRDHLDSFTLADMVTRARGPQAGPVAEAVAAEAVEAARSTA